MASQSIAEEEGSSKFSLFEDCDSTGAIQKFEFEKQMLLQLELKQSLGQNFPQKTFPGFSEAVLEEELPGNLIRSRKSTITKKPSNQAHSAADVSPATTAATGASKTPSRNPQLKPPVVVGTHENKTTASDVLPAGNNTLGISKGSRTTMQSTNCN